MPILEEGSWREPGEKNVRVAVVTTGGGGGNGIYGGQSRNKNGIYGGQSRNKSDEAGGDAIHGERNRGRDEIEQRELLPERAPWRGD